jgi:endonuclease V-like protein UPF0215 family
VIKTQIIKEEGKPVAVVMDYREYVELREKALDKEDYDDAVTAEKETKRLTPIKKVREKPGV